MKLSQDFYLQDDVIGLAKDLLGKVIFTNIDGEISAGIITETEAYAGITDKASHAYGNRKTKRTETMYAEGGCAYIYLCYGMYQLFNVVTNKQNVPHAVLIRAIFPYLNEPLILKRRNKEKWHKNLLNGPGKLTLGLGIDQTLNGASLLGENIWLEDKGICIAESDIEITPRIGIDYAEEDAQLPYRFLIKDLDTIKAQLK